MIKSSEHILRFLMVHARRKGRLAFSSRDALSLIFLAGLPFVMVSSLSINKVINRNVAYAYSVTESSTGAISVEGERLERQFAAQLKGNSDALLRMNGRQVALILNKPGLQRAEGDIGVWQYRTHACVLDLYIADQGAGDVVHYEMRPRIKVTTSVQDNTAVMDASSRRDCMKSVFNGHDGLAPMIFAAR